LALLALCTTVLEFQAVQEFQLVFINLTLQELYQVAVLVRVQIHMAVGFLL